VFTPGISVTQAVVDQVISTVGRVAFRRAVNAAYRQGATTVRQAVDYAVYKLREGPSNVKYRNRKRDIEGGIKPTKLNFDAVQDIKEAMGGDDIQFTRSRAKIGRTRKRTANDLWKAQLAVMDERIYRWQRCSPSLLGPGATPISMGQDTALNVDPDAGPTVVVPFHWTSLTVFPHYQGNQSLGCIPTGMTRMVYRRPPDALQGRFGIQHLASQANTGTFKNNGFWEMEKGADDDSNQQHAINSVFHKYTDIKLNLYGAMRYPMEYTAMVVTGMPVEMSLTDKVPVSTTVATSPSTADFPIADNTPLNEFLMDNLKGLLTNPIIGSSTNQHYDGKLKVLFKKKYKVPCLTYGDAINLANAASGIDSTNVKTVNIFLRHDRFRNYKWHTVPGDVVDNDAIDSTGWDHLNINNNENEGSYCDVDREERVFFILMCNSPNAFDGTVQNVSAPTFNPEVVQTTAFNTTGSYDIVVRNCFRVSGDGVYDAT